MKETIGSTRRHYAYHRRTDAPRCCIHVRDKLASMDQEIKTVRPFCLSPAAVLPKASHGRVIRTVFILSIHSDRKPRESL